MNGWILLKGLSLILFLMFLFPACRLDEDTGFAVVRELRIAGIIAEPPEPAPKKLVHITSFALDPESRELAYLWFNPDELIDPGHGIPEGIQPVAFSSEFNWTAPDTNGTYTLIAFVVPMEFLPEVMGLEDLNNLSEIPHAIAFKNINVTTSSIRNHNPQIEDIVIDPPVFNAGDTITLEAIANDPDGDQLQYAWLSVIPGLSSDYKNPVEFRIPEEITARVYLVVRDNRGGSALRMIELK